MDLSPKESVQVLLDLQKDSTLGLTRQQALYLSQNIEEGLDELSTKELVEVLVSLIKMRIVPHEIFRSLINDLGNVSGSQMKELVEAIALFSPRRSRFTPMLTIGNAIVQHVDKFDVEDMAQILYLFGKNKIKVQPLLEAIACATENKLSWLDSELCSRMLWSYGKFKFSGNFCERLLDEALRRMPSLDDRQFAISIWGLSRLEVRISGTQKHAIIQNCLDQINHLMPPRSLTMIAEAIVHLGIDAPEILDCISIHSVSMIDQFEPFDLVMLAHKLSLVHSKQPILFDAIAATVSKRLNSFEPSQLVSLINSFSNNEMHSDPLFSMLALKLPLSYKSLSSHEMQEFGKAVVQHIEKFDVENMALFAYCYGKRGIKLQPLLEAIACAAELKLSGLDSELLSKLVWSYGKLKFSGFFSQSLLLDEVLRRIPSLDKKQFATSIWGLSQLQVCISGAQKFEIVEKSLDKFDILTPQGLSMVAQAFVNFGIDAPEMYDRIAMHSVSKIDQFDPISIVLLARSLSSVHVHLPTLHDEITSTVSRRLEAFESTHLDSLAKSFSNNEVQSELFFSSLTLKLYQSFDSLSPCGLSKLLSSLARLQVRPKELLQLLSKFPPEKLYEASSDDVVTIVWAFATLRFRAPEFLKTVGDVAIQKLCEFKPAQLATLAWAFAALEERNPTVFKALALDSCENLTPFSNRSIQSLAWSFRKVNIKSSKLLDAINAEVLNRIDNFSIPELRKIIAAFAAFDYEFLDPSLAVQGRLIEHPIPTSKEIIMQHVKVFLKSKGTISPQFFKWLNEQAVERIYELDGSDVSFLISEGMKAGFACEELLEASEQRFLNLDMLDGAALTQLALAYSTAAAREPKFGLVFRGIACHIGNMLNTLADDELSKFITAVGRFDEEEFGNVLMAQVREELDRRHGACFECHD
eukprot:CAMPEP_0117857810 /NCGR_PEP_ID=MMETSP0950-20121206/2123_1 /TAXON_ID=44440 /ORGANISM="Chattonella subsalsa, Strain CCMP2191" /LENGTH=922 /DNA_ID=CAMNT_0005707291 /DNA_START=305 /DNA_END=3074 /DNA_ORIENTATION=-